MPGMDLVPVVNEWSPQEFWMSEIVRISEMLLFDRQDNLFSFGLALAPKQAQLLAVVTLLHVLLGTFLLAASKLNLIM